MATALLPESNAEGGKGEEVGRREDVEGEKQRDAGEELQLLGHKEQLGDVQPDRKSRWD